MKPLSRFIIVYAVLIFISVIFLIPFCGWMYQCGCTFLWAGADRFCNIHHTEEPHCPWCQAGEKPLSAAPLGFAIFVVPAIPMYLVNKKENVSLLKLFVVGFLLFVVAAIISGYIFKLIYDYPHFFFK